VIRPLVIFVELLRKLGVLKSEVRQDANATVGGGSVEAVIAEEAVSIHKEPRSQAADKGKAVMDGTESNRRDKEQTKTL
jgi:hypothetical protein